MLEVVCFGEILWDIFEVGKRGAKPLAQRFRRELGGAPANVATGLSRLGIRTAVVGAVGRDRFGQALRAHLAADGVVVDFVLELPNRTGLTFVMRDARGQPEFVFYRNASADLAIRATDIRPEMALARWVLVGSSTLMTPDLARTTKRFLDLAVGAGARVLVDLNVRVHLWPSRAAMTRAIGGLVGRADLVKASDEDLRALGARPDGIRWLERHAPKASWLITRGASAATAIGEHGEVHLPSLRAKCVDATGAGDAFIAGSLAVLVAARAVPG
ncbi:MAG: carbohydrate kinase, partial [Myxococcota bacterium]|nr:carbohydrate kinase [Myxococcota bacterium]